MTTVFIRRFIFISVVCAILVLGAAPAQDVESILGDWKMVTSFNGNDQESQVRFSMQDGVLKGEASGRRGSRELHDVKFEGDVLSWGLVIPRLSTEPIRIEVKVDGEKFQGAMKTPFGEAVIRGIKWTERSEQELAEATKALLGDWDILTTYNGKEVESQLRFYFDEENDLRAQIVMPGTTLDMRRIRFDGENLTFVAHLPFISQEPARGQLKIAERKLDGVIESPLGEIPIRGEILDTTKLVLAPYDDPQAVLGTWDVVANINGEENAAKLTLAENGERIKGIIQSGESTFESTEADYKKVGDSMGVVRLSVIIPDLGEKPQTFELIFNGDEFEGEEIHSNGAIYFSGKRSAG